MEELYDERLFIELKTFVRKVTQSGETWQAQDLKYHFDDCIFATAFAYVCSLCFYGDPINVQTNAIKAKPKYRLIMDNNYNIKRVKDKAGHM
jgi:hypothetical protein